MVRVWWTQRVVEGSRWRGEEEEVEVEGKEEEK